MAEQAFDQNSSGQRRRKIAALLALLLACITIGIGGSMYYQQKKTKAATLGSTSQEKPADSPSTSAGVVAAIDDAPVVDAPVLGSGPEELTKPEERRAPIAKRSTPKVAAKKLDDMAEQLLASSPTAAGPATPETPAVSLLDPAPAVISTAPAQTPTQLPPLEFEAPAAGPGVAGPGDAPPATNVTVPTGTGGLTPGGDPIVPVTTPVPEPSTWLMMLGGLGLLAAAARRRK